MKSKLISILFLIIFTADVHAIPLRLNATSINTSFITDFYIDFADTGDSLLQFSEITAFSGVTFAGMFLFSEVSVIPTITGISSNESGFTGLWGFIENTDQVAVQIDTFTYGITNTNPVSVPEPATYFLMSLGLIGLAITKRRQYFLKG